MLGPTPQTQARRDGEAARPIRVIVAKLGLDGHDRGIKVIARALRDAGMEVVYLGMRITNQEIAAAALQEDVDVIGLSILSGAHMRLVPKLMDALKGKGLLDRVLVLVGGTIPDRDVEALKGLGVGGVFPVGASTRDIIAFIRENAGGPAK
jgi:methylmalonyl-CoA mutase C-terminal domain/subunit